MSTRPRPTPRALGSDYRGDPLEDARSEPFALAVVALALIVVAGSVLCWGIAHLCLLLTGGQTGHASIREAPQFTARILDTGDPAAAWTATSPASGPVEPGLFWLLLGFTLTLGTVTTIHAGLWLLSRSGNRRSDPATWATARQERRIAVPRDPARRRWRLVAGRGTASGRLLAGDDCVSAVVFGPNGSGKTTSLIVPNVLDWDGPVVLTTAKPQDLEPICAARAKRGPVWVIAPGGAPGHRTVGWSPIEAACGEEEADRVAEWMVASSGMTGDPKARPWNAQARKYLKGLLLAAHHHQHNSPDHSADHRAGQGHNTSPDNRLENRSENSGVEQWLAWIYAGEKATDTVEDLLRTHGHPAAAREYASTWRIHDEGKGSVLFTALGLADTYSRPGVTAAIETGGFTPTDLLDHHGTLCIVTPNAEGDRFAPYFTTLVSAVLHEAETRAARRAGPLEPRLLLALDEAGNVFRYPRLPHLLTTSRGNGIQLLLIYHDLAQIEHLYGGREVARTVVSNAKMRMLLPGVADLDTLRYWSDLIGHTRTQTHGTTTGTDGRRSRTTNDHHDHLAPLHRLQQLPDGHALLLYQNLPPARIRLLPWYTDRRYQHLAGSKRRTGP